jgi:hypothetical protein
MMEILRTLVVSYLAFTLGATALAKIKNREIVTTGIQRERVIPPGIAPVVTVSLASVEFALATLLAFGIEPVAVSFCTAAVFVMFAGYRLLVAAKTKSLTCSCAGEIKSDPASPSSVAGASFAVLFMAALASALSFIGPPVGYPTDLLAMLVWSVPLVAYVIGARGGSKNTGMSNKYSPQLVPLWTADVGTRTRN